MANPAPKPPETTVPGFVKILSPQEKARQTRRKHKLDLLVDSIMRDLTDRPSFDFRNEMPPWFDRQRSAGGFAVKLF